MSSATNRSVELQVIGAGIGRTGTTSLSAALEILGIGPTYDWQSLEESTDQAIDLWVQQITLKKNGKYDPKDGIIRNSSKWDNILYHYAAIVDSPGNWFPIDLAIAYPKAKVILTVRDSAEAWKASWEKSITQQYLAWNQSWSMRVMGVIDDFTGRARQPKTDRVMLALAGAKFPCGEPQISWYDDHFNNAHKHIPADRLLEFNVKQGWEPLCRFLGKEIPNIPFPHVNDAAAYNMNTHNVIREQQERLQWLIIGTLLLVAVPGALLFGPLARALGASAQVVVVGG